MRLRDWPSPRNTIRVSPAVFLEKFTHFLLEKPRNVRALQAQIILKFPQLAFIQPYGRDNHFCVIHDALLDRLLCHFYKYTRLTY